MFSQVLYAYALPQERILHNEHINEQARKSSNISFICVKYFMLFYL